MNKEKYMRMHRHHLLEIILWPNSDGTFRKIINSAKRLRELGIYADWKLTINIPADEHIRMHARNRAEAHRAKISAALIGNKLSADTKAKISAALKGKKHSEEAKSKISAAQIGNNNAKGNKGLHWYTNGVVNKFAKECPLGFTRGKLQKKKRS